MEEAVVVVRGLESRPVWRATTPEPLVLKRPYFLLRARVVQENGGVLRTARGGHSGFRGALLCTDLVSRVLLGNGGCRDPAVDRDSFDSFDRDFTDFPFSFGTR